MTIISDTTYRGYTINCNEAKLCDTKILDAYIDHLEDMTAKHSKVMQIRFDLTYPEYMDSKKLVEDHLSKFINRTTQDIKRNYKLPKEGRQRSSGKNNECHNPDPRILLVREQHGKSDNPHVHGILLVNGNAFHYAPDMMKRIERQYANMLGVDQATGYVDYCNKNGQSSYMLIRASSDFEDKKQQAVHQASYLSKTRGKENREKYSWKALGTRHMKK